MADFKKAFEYLMSDETFKDRHGNIVSHYEDPRTGEISNFGISLKWLKTIDPKATADTVRSLSRDAASDLYEKYWWDANHLGLLPSDNVASKMLDICVNCGAKTGIKMLQFVLNEPLESHEEHLAQDGVVGPEVVAAVAKDCSFKDGEFALLAALVSALEGHYRSIAASNPVLQPDLPEWLKRAEKLPA